MEFDFLSPINSEILQFTETLAHQQLGHVISKHTLNSFPNLDDANIAIIGVLENRNSDQKHLIANLSPIRQKLYQLYTGNWQTNIVDLGDILNGENVADTYFALNSITSSLLKKGITTIVLGGSQDLTYPIYRAFDNLDQMVNLVCIDNKFDLGDAEYELTSNSYLSKIIIDEPNNLNNFSNIGYQTYYNSQEEINLLEKLYFDAYRLGAITSNIEIAEPILRNANIISLDMTVVKAFYINAGSHFEPNGFDGKEICTLARYAGISDKIDVIGLFNHNNSEQQAILLAQIIWYFIEGYSLRNIEFPSSAHDSFLKYIVSVDDQELIFFKSIKTQRWWIEVPIFSFNNNKKLKQSLLPCSYQDYLSACEQQIPDRWWKAQQKNIL